jgi:hypothetical protein
LAGKRPSAEERFRAACANARERQRASAVFPTYNQWLKEVSPDFDWDWPHLLLIQKKLDAILRGDIRRLIVTVPPQHGKSSLLTERFPAYLVERDPKFRVGVGSYNQSFANKFGRRNLQIAAERIPLSPFIKSVREWETLAHGGMKSVGVGAGITGTPLDGLIIDDPIKDRIEAESETYRQRVWNWWVSALRTRLQKTAWVILIMTRWHHRDLAGKLLYEASANAKADQWELLNLMALAEEDDPLGRQPGEPLCTQRFPLENLLQTKATLPEQDWESLYQQRPTPRKGGVFNNDCFEFADAPPEGLFWVRYWDLALKTHDRSSATASVAVAIDDHGTIWAREPIRFKKEWPEARRIIKEVMLRDPIVQGVEAKLHGIAAVQEFREDRELSHVPIEECQVDGDKYLRALGWAARQRDRKVILIGMRPQWTDLLTETAQFPNGAFDDLIDSFSGGVALHAKYGGEIEEGGRIW